jgi:hypothetical protein
MCAQWLSIGVVVLEKHTTDFLMIFFKIKVLEAFID